jgi:hypothetical protein
MVVGVPIGISSHQTSVILFGRSPTQGASARQSCGFNASHYDGIAPRFNLSSFIKALASSSTWADATLITDKASKADDAEVAFSTWDQRILLVIPPCISLLQKTSRAGFSSPPISPVQALNRIRDLVQQKQWKLIFLDFRAFLIERHGPNWASTLCAARAAQRIRAASSLPPAFKRSKGGRKP